jgi:hypothetical protein
MKGYVRSGRSRIKNDLPLSSSFEGFEMSRLAPSVIKDDDESSSQFSYPSHHWHDETANLMQEPIRKGLDASSTYDSSQTSFLEPPEPMKHQSNGFV